MYECSVGLECSRLHIITYYLHPFFLKYHRNQNIQNLVSQEGDHTTLLLWFWEAEIESKQIHAALTRSRPSRLSSIGTIALHCVRTTLKKSLLQYKELVQGELYVQSWWPNQRSLLPSYLVVRFCFIPMPYCTTMFGDTLLESEDTSWYNIHCFSSNFVFQSWTGKGKKRTKQSYDRNGRA